MITSRQEVNMIAASCAYAALLRKFVQFPSSTRSVKLLRVAVLSCCSFQSPVEVPGVSNSDFLRLAANARRKQRGEEELDPLEFYGFVMPKVWTCPVTSPYSTWLPDMPCNPSCIKVIYRSIHGPSHVGLRAEGDTVQTT